MEMFDLININKIFLDSLLILFLIIFWTFLQWFHYKFLGYIQISLWKTFHVIISVIIRLWIIIHEFSHIIFAFINWSKVIKIELFRKDWWRVILSEKDFIWSMAYNNHSFSYFLLMLLNRIWIFTTNLWPLIIWITINILLFNYVFWINIDNYNDFSKVTSMDIRKIVVLTIYIFIILPSFMVSYQDISNIVFYKSNFLIITIVWSMINFLFLALFLYICTFFIKYIVSFFIFYFAVFLTLTCLYLVIYLSKKLLVTIKFNR